MGDDGGGGYGESSYSVSDTNASYSGDNNYEGHYSGGVHSSGDNYYDSVTRQGEGWNESALNESRRNNNSPVAELLDSDSQNNHDGDWNTSAPHSPTAERLLNEEDSILPDYTPESKEKLNGLSTMLMDEGDNYGEQTKQDDNGCSGDDCCYYTVVCCDCTIL